MVPIWYWSDYPQPAGPTQPEDEMISRVHFQDYKVFRSLDIELGPINVLVGRNGVGKTTILEGVYSLLGLARERNGEDQWKNGRPGLAYSGPNAVANLVAKPAASSFVVDLRFTDGRRFGLRADRPESEESPAHFEVWFGTPGSEVNLAFPNDAGTNPRILFKQVADAGLGSVAYLRLDPNALAAPHYADTEAPQIARDGSGLASVLGYLQGLRDGVLEQIEQDVSKVIPEFRKIRTLPARIKRKERLSIVVNGQETWADQTRELTGTRFEVEWGDSGWISAEQLSEGTLLVLGILSILRFRPPQLLLLDDIDRALHPVAQGDIVRMIKTIVGNIGATQILATAHSPFVLDGLEPNEVLVVGADPVGGSKVCRLNCHPVWAKKGRYLASGEFWSVIGEGWVAESVR
jgi:predicted ATPase